MVGGVGKRGPAPTPTRLRVLKGDRPHRINGQEPAPPTSLVEPPASLSEAALVEWNRYAPSLIKAGLLTLWDAPTFAMLCTAIVMHRDAAAKVDGLGEGGASLILVMGPNGQTVKNPALQVVRDQALLVRALAQEFGMTPSARSALKLGVSKSDAGEDLLTQPG
jgi:P27 family predicted phage terminase small subunit